MISHKYKCIFLHIPKSGGSTIKCLLKEIDKNAVPLGHMPISKMKNDLNFNESYFKFTFVRNPWARLNSLYFFLLNQTPKHIHYKYDKLKVRFLQDNNISFSEFIKECSVNFINSPDSVRGGFNLNAAPYTDRYILPDNPLDFIGKVENFQEDFNTICDKIGIPHQELPHKNASKHKHYTEYYDDETRQIVAEKYAKDIEYFGYKFGE